MVAGSVVSQGQEVRPPVSKGTGEVSVSAARIGETQVPAGLLAEVRNFRQGNGRHIAPEIDQLAQLKPEVAAAAEAVPVPAVQPPPTPAPARPPAAPAPAANSSIAIKEVKDLTQKEIERSTPAQLRALAEEKIKVPTFFEPTGFAVEKMSIMSIAQLRAVGNRYRSLSQDNTADKTALDEFRKSHGFGYVLEAMKSPTNYSDDEVGMYLSKIPKEMVGKCMTGVVLQNLKPNQLHFLALEGLLPEQFNMLSNEQLRAISPEQLKRLKPEQLSALSNTQLKCIDVSQLTPTQIQSDARLVEAYMVGIDQARKAAVPPVDPRRGRDDGLRPPPLQGQSIDGYIPDVTNVRSWPEDPKRYAQAQGVWKTLQKIGGTWRDLNLEILGFKHQYDPQAKFDHVDQYPQAARGRLQELLQARHELQMDILWQRDLLERLGCQLQYSHVPDPSRRIGFVPQQ